MRFILSLFLLLVFVLPGIAQADDSAPLFYSRSNIMIMRKNLPTLPWSTKETVEKDAAQKDTGAIFDVEVRDATSYYNQQGWFNLSSPSTTGGVMLVFSKPALAPVIGSAQYMPLDILMVDEQGKIIQILPNIVLSELKKEIYPANPILAMVFLKGGICKAMSINPGDDINYKIFGKPPEVLTAPVQSTTLPVTPHAAQPQ